MTACESLYNAVVSVLERAAFLTVTDLPTQGVVRDSTRFPFESSERVITAIIQCPFGMVALLVSPELGELMVANMLGEDLPGSDSVAEARDAVGEVTNMVAGLLFEPPIKKQDGDTPLPLFRDVAWVRRQAALEGRESACFVGLKVEGYPLVAVLCKGGVAQNSDDQSLDCR